MQTSLCIGLKICIDTLYIVNKLISLIILEILFLSEVKNEIKGLAKKDILPLLVTASKSSTIMGNSGGALHEFYHL